MKKRPSIKQDIQSKSTKVLGIAWFKPQQWDRLLQISADRDELETTYEEWKNFVEKSVREMQKIGIRIKKLSSTPKNSYSGATDTSARWMLKPAHYTLRIY